MAAPWWDATRERRLLVQTCGACGHRQHHPRLLCTNCGGTDALGWTPCAGTGTVDSFTVVHRSPEPERQVPYVVARVRLTEGPILLTNLVGIEVDDSILGAGVVLAWSPLPDGRNLPVFTLATEA
ncbi:MAG: hypothetical protein EPN43_00730 [Jatrophihabitans sp.]|nr:MAG: hypothetical protein EPN43_00730 [Jatrophihabitans sp.]